MSQETTYRILGDRPIQSSEEDVLQFDDFVRPLASRIVRSTDNTPFTVGILAAWGSGKTSIMLMLKTLLEADGCRAIWYEPWRYKSHEDVWKGLVYALQTELSKWDDVRNEIRRKRKRITGAAARVLLGKILGKGGDPIYESISSERWSPALLHDFEQAIDDILEALEASGTGRGRRPLVLFIDDLDRCMPETILTVLEAINLVLSRRDLVVVMAISEGEVVDAVRANYKSQLKAIETDVSPEWGQRFLRKIIHYPFHVPPLSQSLRHEFIESCLQGSDVVEHVGVGWVPIIDASCDSLRDVKWLLNRFISEVDKTLSNIVSRDGSGDLVVEAPRAFFIMILAYRHPGFIKDVRIDPTRYFEYQDAVASEEATTREGVGFDADIYSIFETCLSEADDGPLVRPIEPGKLQNYLSFGSVIVDDDELRADVEDLATLEVAMVRTELGVSHISDFLPRTGVRLTDRDVELLAMTTIRVDGDSDVFMAADLTEELRELHAQKVEEARANRSKRLEELLAATRELGAH